MRKVQLSGRHQTEALRTCIIAAATIILIRGGGGGSHTHDVVIIIGAFPRHISTGYVAGWGPYEEDDLIRHFQ